jgi:hypothetical protein
VVFEDLQHVEGDLRRCAVGHAGTERACHVQHVGAAARRFDRGGEANSTGCVTGESKLRCRFATAPDANRRMLRDAAVALTRTAIDVFT